jgi:hypothetical protein
MFKRIKLPFSTIRELQQNQQQSIHLEEKTLKANIKKHESYIFVNKRFNKRLDDDSNPK